MKTLSRIFVLVALAIAVMAGPQVAQSQATDYADLTLRQAAPDTQFIIDGAYWMCRDLACHGYNVGDMPALRSCQRVVVYTGAVTSFTWRGKSLGPDDIAACNTRAK